MPLENNTIKTFITGIAGRDGSYLAGLLLEKGYEANGLVWSINHEMLLHSVPCQVR